MRIRPHQRSSRPISRAIRLLGIAVALVAVLGCEREPDVRRYTAVLDPAPPPLVMPSAASATGTGVPVDRHTLAVMWDTPNGWEDTGVSNQFRVTTLRTTGDDAGVEVAVSRVPGPAGSITDNVNRWRGQLSLPPLEKPEVVPLVDYAPNDHLSGFITDMRNADQRALIAWFQLDHESWFFKATGTPTAIDTHRAGFDQLVASVRRNLDEDHDHPADPSRAPAPATTSPDTDHD